MCRDGATLKTVIFSLLVISFHFGYTTPNVWCDVPIFHNQTMIDAQELRHWPCQPHVCDWNNDDRKDLVLGVWCMDIIYFYENVGTDTAPEFSHAIVPPYLRSSEVVDLHDPCPVVVDWNNDGVKDLLIGRLHPDNGLGSVLLFLNQGTAEDPYFPDYEFLMAGGDTLFAPDLEAAPWVVDWNQDGKKDLLVGKNGHGVQQAIYYENMGTDDNPVLAAGDTLRELTGEDTVVFYTGIITTVDWNNDGVLDLISSNPFTAGLRIYIRQLDFPINFVGSGVYLQAGGELIPCEETFSCAGLRAESVDWDDDGRKDLIMGAGDEKGIILYRNIGTDDSPILAAGEQIITAKDFGAGKFAFKIAIVDWNNDDLKDLVIGTADFWGTSGYIDVYHNSGTNDEPEFTFRDRQMLNGSPIDIDPGQWHSRSSPCVVDWNADGKIDLLSGSYTGNIYLYINTALSPDSSPEFSVEDTVKDSTGAYLNIGLCSVPTVVDWNNDSLNDLVIGDFNGLVILYRNIGTPISPSFGQPETIPNVDIGSHASPFVIDFDGDGKKDLLIGNMSGDLYYCKNTGSDSAPSFAGYVNIQDMNGDILFPYGYTAPYATDWNNDGILDLLVGQEQIFLYIGSETGIFENHGVVNQPGGIQLLQSYPNPTAQGAWIPFVVDRADDVAISIYNLAGRLIRVLSLGARGTCVQSGAPTAIYWDGLDDSGQRVVSGTYFYQIKSGAASSTPRKMVIIK